MPQTTSTQPPSPRKKEAFLTITAFDSQKSSDSTFVELARHVIAVRAGWFHYNLEEGDEDFGAFHEWSGPGSLPRSAYELVSGLEKTWQVMQEVLGRYTLTDLQATIQDEWEGQIYTYTRGWVIWLARKCMNGCQGKMPLGRKTQATSGTQGADRSSCHVSRPHR